MKKHFIKFVLLLSLLLSVSCKNLFENSVNSDEDKIENTGAAISASNPASEKRTCVQLSGRLEYNNSGASPSEINSILENTNSNQTSSVSSERSANPSIPTVTSNADCQYEYYIKATPNSGQAREEIASLVDGAWQYNITLEIGKTWTFEAGLRKKAQGTFGEDDYVGPQTLLIDFESDTGHPFSQALTETTTNIEKIFILKPRQNGGYGKIDLAMKKVPSTVNQMIIKIYDSNGTEQTALLGKLEYGIDSSTDAGNFIQSVPEGDNEYIFPSGIYDFVITFSQGYGTDPNRVYFPVYTTTQTVAVFDNMTTSVWKNGNSSASYSVIDSSGNFELTSNILQHYANTTLYVGKFSNTAADASDNGNSGSPFEPLATLTGAFNKIQANQNLQTGSDTYAYRIILCENQTGNFEIPAAITASKVSSIDISSYNTRTVLNGGNSGTVLAINSTVPVTLSNVQITGGNAENGGGISMASGTKLTLGAGALVGRDVQTLAGSGTSDHGNYATGFGAGIYVENATLILKNGSKVCNNYLDSSAVLSGGGGIALCGGSLTIENGAAVSWNKSAARAGGIMVPYTATTASTITMKGGEISHNEAGRYGGGVIIGHTGGTYSAKTFNLSGGTISENNVTGTGSKPSRGGAGVFFDGGNFTMSGNAVIEKNTALGCGGGISISASGEASGTFTMTGGIIRNNSAGTGGAIYFDDVSDELSEKSYSISGSASIPYGVDGTQGSGKNDVYIGKTGSIEIAAALSDTFPDTGLSSGNWVRGKAIIKLASGVSLSENLLGKFKCLQLSTDWEKVISSTKVTVNCPFYVGSYNGTAGLDTNPGTKISPYETIEKACQQMDDPNTEYIIKITGTTNAVPQNIPAALSTSGTYKAKSVSIIGVNNATYPPVINRGLINSATVGSDDGSALAINSTVPVTITNVKITGGWTTGSGGGIALNSSGTLSLGDGVVITGNRSDNSGGGVFVRSGTVFIYGSAQIGQRPADKVSSAPVANNGVGNCANWTDTYGGGIYAGRNDNETGKVYLGYYKDFATNTIEKDVNFSGGIYYNYAGVGGGAICAGGVEGSNSVVQISGGIIAYNYAQSNGGGIRNNYGNIEIYGGTIKENYSAEGGAISYINGSLAFKGSLSIPYGTGIISLTNPLNDIWISSGKSIFLDSNFALSDSTKKIKLTPASVSGSSFKKRNILTGSISNDNFNKFDLNVLGFKLTSTSSNGTDYGTLTLKNIITDIYVSSASGTADPTGNTIEDSTWNNSTYEYNAYTNNSAKPFASLSKALQFITYQESASAYNIYITGTLTDTQFIGDSTTDANNPVTLSSATATKITLRGTRDLDSNGDPQDILNGGFSSAGSKGTTLIINTNVPVDILRLGITGGYTSSSGKGGGIYIEASSTNTVTLGDGTAANGPKIYGNYACQGGGIYKKGANLNLVIKDGTRICGNYSNLGSGSTNGGGVYNYSGSLTMTGGEISGNHSAYYGGGVYNMGSFYMSAGNISGNEASYGGGLCNDDTGAKLFMSGSAIIGKTDANATVGADTEGANKATSYGGGIFNRIGYIFIGYTAENVPAALSGGVIGNYAGRGGGIYLQTNYPLNVAAGKISFNKSIDIAGGIYAENDITLDGSAYSIEMKDNVGSRGGAIDLNSINKNVNIKGNVSIPSTSAQNNDIALPDSRNKVNVTGALGGTGVVASITPVYTTTSPVLTVADGVTDITLPVAVTRFAVSATESSAWILDSEGKLQAVDLLTSGSIESLELTGGQTYSFIAASDFTSTDLQNLITKINAMASNDTPIGNSTIDLSMTAITYLTSNNWIPAKITKLILPVGLTDLQAQVFQESEDLEEVVLPGGENSAFCVENGILYNKNKTMLVYYPAAKSGSSYTLPDTVIKLHQSAFKYNKNLEVIYGLERITDLNGDGVFSACEKLEEVNLSGLTSNTLGGWQFGSHIKKIIVSASVTTWASYCFSTGLEEIHFLGSTPPSPSGSGINVPSGAKIYVPTGSKSAYEAKSWAAGREVIEE